MVEHDHNSVARDSSARVRVAALAGLVIAAFGSGWAILSNAVTYGAMILALTLMNSALLSRAGSAPAAGSWS